MAAKKTSKAQPQEQAKPTRTEEITAECIRHFGEIDINDRVKIEVVVVRYGGKGRPVLDIRKYYRESARDDEWLPGKRPSLGGVEHIDEIMKMLEEGAAFLKTLKTEEDEK